MTVVRIKVLCKRAGIARLDGGRRAATVAFHLDKFANPAGLVQFLHDQKGDAKIRDNKIVLRRELGRSEGPAGRRLPGRARSGGARKAGGSRPQRRRRLRILPRTQAEDCSLRPGTLGVPTASQAVKFGLPAAECPSGGSFNVTAAWPARARAIRFEAQPPFEAVIGIIGVAANCAS